MSAVIPVYYFERISGPHKLNHRFDAGMRIIDIQKEYDSPQFYIGGVFVNRRFIKTSNIRFDESMIYMEDALFINQVILKDLRYGVIPDARYHYRKRYAKNSLVDHSLNEKKNYMHLLREGYGKLIDLSLTEHRDTLHYIQYLILYHLKLLFSVHQLIRSTSPFSVDEYAEFEVQLAQLLSHFDDVMIMRSGLNVPVKRYLLGLKYGSTAPALLSSGNLTEPSLATVHITAFKPTGLQFMISGYIEHSTYLIKPTDDIFLRSFGRVFHDRKLGVIKQRNSPLSIDNFYHRFSFKVPFWALTFQVGILTTNGPIVLHKYNLLEKLIIRIKDNLMQNSSR